MCNFGREVESRRKIKIMMATMMGRRQVTVKNKNPASIQITAEQILLESQQHQQQETKINHNITDQAELSDYNLRQRKHFESQISLHRGNNLNIFLKYAQFEESQNNFARARSIFERALQDHYRNPSLWCKYAEFEMKNGFINHARNIWDRAVSFLPRVSQLWYKFIHLEEMLGNLGEARGVFEQWMSWLPDQQGWVTYIKFEIRYKEVERARVVFERFVECCPEVDSWIRYARFEIKNGEVGRARKCYERAVEKILGGEHDDEDDELFISFAEFEEGCKEIERARGIYKLGLKSIPRGRDAEESLLYRKSVAFEKQYGGKEDVENAIVDKRRCKYEDELRKNPLNYDVWFDYIHLEESIPRNIERIREVYERAIANVPPAEEKHYWQRYIYLWIKYALFEELDAQDMERTREVYRECLNWIPHHKFSFSKVWLLAAKFEIRQKNLDGARKLLGNWIGRVAKDKTFQKYIEIELKLGNIDRCRTLYEKYLEWAPYSCCAWTKYAEFEHLLCEIERARAVFELAIAQPTLDMPELVWKAYIDFEISQGEYEKTRQIYERLLNRTKHLKVWSSYANFEATASMDGSDMLAENDQASLVEQRKQCLHRARRIFKTSVDYFRTSVPELKEERAMLLEEWLNVERDFGVMGDVRIVEKMMPKKLKRRREGNLAGYEEYLDYLFPEEFASPNLKILEAAYQWKRQKLQPSYV